MLQLLCCSEPRMEKDKMWKKQNRSTAPMTRPVKSAVERKRRLKVQKKRLVALGVKEEALRRMTTGEVRAMLRRPSKLASSAGK